MPHNPEDLVAEINRLRALDKIRKTIAQDAEQSARDLAHRARCISKDLKEELERFRSYHEKGAGKEALDEIFQRCCGLAVKLGIS